MRATADGKWVVFIRTNLRGKLGLVVQDKGNGVLVVQTKRVGQGKHYRDVSDTDVRYAKPQDVRTLRHAWEKGDRWL